MADKKEPIKPGKEPNSKFNLDLIPEVFKNLAQEGKTVKEIAAIFGVSSTTVYRWFEAQPAVRESIKEGRAQIDDKVEQSFLRRCLGLNVKETREVVTPKGEILELRSEKELPPDVGACMKWLGARRPDKWGDSPKNDNVEEELEIPPADK